MTALVLCAHGTRDAAGRAVIRGVVEAVAAALPEMAVHEAYVDVHGPEVGEVVAALPPADEIEPRADGRRVAESRDGGQVPAGVVVPLLLAAGYHVHVDLADAVRARPDVVVSPALGPDDRLVDILVGQMMAAGVATGAGVGAGAAVVLAPAGSSDARAQAGSAEMARRLGERLGRPVSLGYAAGPSPSVADEVTRMRAEGAASVAIASYLLAPGFFQRRLEQCGADVVTGPLAPDPRLVDIVLDRFHAAVAGPSTSQRRGLPRQRRDVDAGDLSPG
ncbi:MAG: sirohydrochlorin chelatase [Dermatophilaceae bacterium]